MEALASCQEMRQALRSQKTNRGYYPQKGKQKVHIEQLKLRTCCNRCGAEGTGRGNAPCHGNPTRDPPPSQTHRQDTALRAPATPRRASSLQRERQPMRATRRSTGCASFCRSEARRRARVPSDDRSEGAYRVRTAGRNEVFCGTTTDAMDGIVDTAAESSLIGSQALVRLLQRLQKYGLKARWTTKVATAKRVGGAAESLGVIMIPIGIGGVSGILETTVVQGDVSFLLPVSLKALRVKLDFGTYPRTSGSCGCMNCVLAMPCYSWGA